MMRLRVPVWVAAVILIGSICGARWLNSGFLSGTPYEIVVCNIPPLWQMDLARWTEHLVNFGKAIWLAMALCGTGYFLLRRSALSRDRKPNPGRKLEEEPFPQAISRAGQRTAEEK
ncbi:MAG: hypothetical protein HY926_13355 [Elusimicrobia bacterium]|nr:hypothetical protein [Elusimicrobiota bacterium]